VHMKWVKGWESVCVCLGGGDRDERVEVVREKFVHVVRVCGECAFG